MATKKKTAAKKSSAKKAARRPAARKSTAGRATKSSGRGRTPNAAFMRPVTPDDALGAVVGTSPMPRTELTKKLWAYIRRKGLQDQKNRRMINADENLRPVFGGKSQVSMFDMTRLVNRHVS
jgi:upstream activation factor subunit UAF30